ncbi:MAG: hypothetical protein HZA19_05415 [Nitrospirae bacterium]|nr:hypothetical protein [Nitrospirota bacterium]
MSFPSWVLASDVRLVRSDAAGATLEATVSDFRVDLTGIASKQFQHVTIPEWGQSKEIGKPQVPLRGALIGIPEEGRVTLKITGSDYQVLHLQKDFAPAAPPLVSTTPFPMDKTVYQKDSFYPGPLAVEGFTGYMRDQKVMQVLFYPVQYNPVTREVRVYKRILVDVTFEQPTPSTEQPTPSTARGVLRKGKQPAGVPANAYEKLLQDSLLNYGSLHR